MPTPSTHPGKRAAVSAKWVLAGSVSAILSGVLHVLIGITGLVMPTTYGISSLYGSATQLVSGMLTAIGLFELSYGFVVRSLRNWKKFGPALVIGILGFLFSIVLYLASLATPLPLSVPQQTITLISVVPFIAKILEAIFITSAANLLRAK